MISPELEDAGHKTSSSSDSDEDKPDVSVINLARPYLTNRVDDMLCNFSGVAHPFLYPFWFPDS